MVNEDHLRCSQCGLVGHDISACTANADENSGSDMTDEPQKFIRLFGVNIYPNCPMTTEDGKKVTKKNDASTSPANGDNEDSKEKDGQKFIRFVGLNMYLNDDPMMNNEDGKTETKKDATIFTAIDGNDDSNEEDVPKTGIIINDAGETATQEALHRRDTKGLNWSNEERQKFALAAKEVGSSNHKEIAEKYVKTRTRTQVASYAQKYRLREESSAGKRKRTSLKDASFKRPDDKNAEQDWDSQQQASTAEPKMKKRSLKMSASNAPPDQLPDNVEQESSVHRASILPCSSNSDSLPQVGKQKSPLQHRHPPSCSSDSNSRLQGQQAELDVDTNKEHQINNPEEDGTSDTEDDHRSQ